MSTVRRIASEKPGTPSKRPKHLPLDRLIERSQQIDRKALQNQIVAGPCRVAAPPDSHHGHAICSRRKAPQHPRHRLSIGHCHVDQRQIVVGRTVGGREDETVGVISRQSTDDLDDALEGQAKSEGRDAKRRPGIGIEGGIQIDRGRHECRQTAAESQSEKVGLILHCDPTKPERNFSKISLYGNRLRVCLQVKSEVSANCRSLSRAKLSKNESASGSTVAMAGSTRTQV